jgi:transposase-like protein
LTRPFQSAVAFGKNLRLSPGQHVCRRDVAGVFCLSWKWRERSAVKITERAHEKDEDHYSAEEKVAILRRHLLDQEPISKLCDELGLQPTVFYRWQKEFFENGAAAFQTKLRTNHQPEQERIEYLTKKIQTKDEVLAELMAEHIALKKSLGEI